MSNEPKEHSSGFMAQDRTIDDCISRQAAIDAPEKFIKDCNPEHFVGHQKFIEYMDNAEIGSFGNWQFANGFNMGLTAAEVAIKRLPSAQVNAESTQNLTQDSVLETQKPVENTCSEQGDSSELGVKTGETCTDCISRQAAIEAICEHGTRLERRGITVLAVANHKQATVDLLESLPSAQPIIHCAECKWFQCNMPPDGYLPEGVDEFECRHWCGGCDPIDFCSYARRRENE